MAKCVIDQCTSNMALTVVATNCIDTNIITPSIIHFWSTLIHIYRDINTEHLFIIFYDLCCEQKIE